MESLLKEEDWSPELLEHELCEEMAMQIMELPPPRPPAPVADAMQVMAEEAGDELHVVGRGGGGTSFLEISVTSARVHSEFSCGRSLPSAMALPISEGYRRPVLLFRGLRLKVGINMGQVGGWV